MKQSLNDNESQKIELDLNLKLLKEERDNIKLPKECEIDEK